MLVDRGRPSQRARLILAVCLVAAAQRGIKAQQPAGPGPAAPSGGDNASVVEAPVFERDVLPILTAHCFKCHGLEARKANLDLRTVGLMLRGGDSGPVLVRGSLAESRLWEMVADRSMPPENELPLTTDQIEMIRRWVAGGARAISADPSITDAEAPAVTAEDRSFWAFQKPVRHTPPGVRQSERARTPVDAFVLAKLEEQGLRFSPEADLPTLIRRVSFDLTGLPPTREEVAQFVAEATSAGKRDAAYQRLVDRLLASPHYGERWGRHWLDAAGYVDVLGSDNDAAIIKPGENKWLYRDYVVGAFNEDQPYDRFVAEQLAGDELVDWRAAQKFTPEIRRLLVATGYLRAAVDDTDQKELNIALVRYRVLHLTIDVVGTHLLGLTTGCARCHSHKFDPIPQRDYYRLMALFTPAYNPQAWVALPDRHLPDVSPAEQQEMSAHNAELDRQVEPLKAQVAAVESAQRERLFDQKLAALPEPIRADTKAALQTPDDQRTGVQKYLAAKLAPLLAVTPEEVAAALGDEDQAAVAGWNRQIAELNRQRRSWGKIHALYDAGPAPPTFLLRRGDHETPGAEVEPGFLSILSEDDGALVLSGPSPAGTSGRRLALARWLTDPNSRAGGLTARVMVNRVWQHLFGEGIVATPENFGHNGARPTHPELLDWLAAEFIAGGWRVKPLIKLVTTSSVYRQASTRALAPQESMPAAAQAGSAALEHPADPEVVDPANQLLWRMRLRRLESEAVRDAILAASGRLDRTLGGPPLLLENRPDGMVVVDVKALPAQATPWRRSLYVLARRNYHLSLLGDFDQPAVATNCTRRAPSAVVLQSLTMLNDAFVLDQAGFFAERVAAASPGGPPERQVELAFEMALARAPQPQEAAWAAELLKRQTDRHLQAQLPAPEAARQALANLCHMLLNTSEFLYLE